MLTEDQLNILRTTLIEAADKHLANNGKIVSGFFSSAGDDEETKYGTAMCPIGSACFSNMDVNDPESNWRSALEKTVGFSITAEEFWGLVKGFDGNLNDTPTGNLGEELRKKYQPLWKVKLILE